MTTDRHLDTTDHAIVAPAVTGDPGTRDDAGGFDPGRAYATRDGRLVRDLERENGVGRWWWKGTVDGRAETWWPSGHHIGGCVSATDLVNVHPAAPDPIPQPEGDAPPAPAQSAGAAAHGEDDAAEYPYVTQEHLEEIVATWHPVTDLHRVASELLHLRRRGARPHEPAPEPIEVTDGATPEILVRAVREAIDLAYARAGGRYDNSVRVSLPAVFVDWLLQRAAHEPADASARSARGEVADAVPDDVPVAYASIIDGVVVAVGTEQKYAALLGATEPLYRARPTPAAVLDRARPAGQGEGEPAGWQWRNSREDFWHFAAKEDRAAWEASLYKFGEYRALYAAPPSAAAAPPAPDSREAILKEACKPWEHSSGDAPDWDSPLHQVFVAGMLYTEQLLANALDIENFERGDGSEDFDADATTTLLNILVEAGAWDPDENTLRATSAPAQDAGPAGVTEVRQAFNDALDFALDEEDDLYNKIEFLRIWREGGDLSEWPDFDAFCQARIDAAARARTPDAGKPDKSHPGTPGNISDD